MKSNASPENFEIFRAFAEDYCDRHNKTIKVYNRKSVTENGAKYGGWCDGETMVVASKNNLFEDLFVHEFSHMTQAVENAPIWQQRGDIWQGLSKNKIKISHWPDYLKTIELERDCERRSINFIRKFKIMDDGKYARRANLYLYYYQFVFLTNKWHDSTSIYQAEQICELMPDKLLPAKIFNKIDMDVMQLFQKHFYKR